MTSEKWERLQKLELIVTQLRKALLDDTIRGELDWWANNACAVELLTLVREVQDEEVGRTRKHTIADIPTSVLQNRQNWE